MDEQDRKYIDYLIEREEQQAEEGLARYAGYIDYQINRDREELNDLIRKTWAFHRESILGLGRAVDRVYKERFDLPRVTREMDGPETEFQKFMREERGLTPVFSDSLDDFMDDEVAIVDEPDGEFCTRAAYRRAVK